MPYPVSAYPTPRGALRQLLIPLLLVAHILLMRCKPPLAVTPITLVMSSILPNPTGAARARHNSCGMTRVTAGMATLMPRWRAAGRRCLGRWRGWGRDERANEWKQANELRKHKPIVGRGTEDDMRNLCLRGRRRGRCECYGVPHILSQAEGLLGRLQVTRAPWKDASATLGHLGPSWVHHVTDVSCDGMLAKAAWGWGDDVRPRICNLPQPLR